MHAHLQQALEAIDRETAGVAAERLARSVRGKWSAAEILEHLRLAFTTNAQAVEKPLETGSLRARRPTATQWLARTLVVDVGYFPRVRAPEQATPRGVVPADGIVEVTRAALVALDAALQRGADRFGEDTPILNHPYFAGLSVRQWRRFHWRHTVHHMKQVRERIGT